MEQGREMLLSRKMCPFAYNGVNYMFSLCDNDARGDGCSFVPTEIKAG